MMFEPADQDHFDPVRREHRRGDDPSAYTARILVAVPEIEERVEWLALATSLGHRTTCAEDYAAACDLLANDGYGVVIIHPDFDSGRGMKLARHIHRCRYRAKMVLITDESAFDMAVEALRLGMVDVLRMPVQPETLRYALEGAVLRSREERMQLERINRLRDMCRTLNAAKQETTRQVDSLCADLAQAYEGIADQMSEVAMSVEFRTLLSQELDIEALLRTSLEYLLTRTGPTNAAVFLPDPEGDYALGAYVNWDCPREQAGVMLEHLGRTICPRMEDEHEIVMLETSDDLSAWLGVDVPIVDESRIVAFNCTDGGDTLAVIVLFRDRNAPFDPRLASELDALRTIFARQLASVIRVHHRAQPPWPAEPAEDGWEIDDEYGFAA